MIKKMSEKEITALSDQIARMVVDGWSVEKTFLEDFHLKISFWRRSSSEPSMFRFRLWAMATSSFRLTCLNLLGTPGSRTSDLSRHIRDVWEATADFSEAELPKVLPRIIRHFEDLEGLFSKSE